MEGWIVTFHQELLSTTTIICEDESTNNTLLMYCFSKMKVQSLRVLLSHFESF
jgi:hypothetical protein